MPNPGNSMNGLEGPKPDMDKTTQLDHLTERQRRELEYHRDHAQHCAYILEQEFSFEVTEQTQSTRRWWNAYWEMYWFLIQQNLQEKTVLVVGCGFGEDALRLAKLGAKVYAFDLSPDSLQIAQQLAEREQLSIHFSEQPAETLNYESDFFDLVLARDILHHVDIPEAMREINRVSKPGALFVYDEVYSHSLTDTIRHSKLVEQVLYPLMQNFVYDNKKPYITEDERKLSERDCEQINQVFNTVVLRKYYYFIVNRVLPEKYDPLNQLDRMILAMTGFVGRWIAGRILVAGSVNK